MLALDHDMRVKRIISGVQPSQPCRARNLGWGSGLEGVQTLVERHPPSPLPALLDKKTMHVKQLIAYNKTDNP